jgi:DNA-binding transcriptional LysR family regulator
MVRHQFEAIGIAVKVPFVVDSYEQAQQLAASGLGVAVLPERLPLSPSLVSNRVADALYHARLLWPLSVAAAFPQRSALLSNSSAHATSALRRTIRLIAGARSL